MSAVPSGQARSPFPHVGLGLVAGAGLGILVGALLGGSALVVYLTAGAAVGLVVGAIAASRS